MQKTQVKKAAVDIVQGLTGSEDGLQSLCSHSDVLIPSLSRVLSEKKVLFISCLHKKPISIFFSVLYLAGDWQDNACQQENWI